MPVEMPDTKVTASPPKPRPETSIKQKPDNPPDSVRTSISFCVTSFGDLYLEGLIHGGAYFRNFTVTAINNIRRTRIQARIKNISI